MDGLGLLIPLRHRHTPGDPLDFFLQRRPVARQEPGGQRGAAAGLADHVIIHPEALAIHLDLQGKVLQRLRSRLDPLRRLGA